ncbi:mitochondrial carrier domain-containing protein [Microdochium trichocladiopsis]|uniref:Mitochondrial thiamine pyrophosphate carrier 1 n=1 Tax=Microdochium trichocladiopsis TaxID=1682393 RepID=A0A9P8XWH4_9PEZI|nr:mitochondrial carrier domain-containing protein [Microdochium trichocladiopsis]KAH7021217.1 mitochondrial carrier domain-containing protein [Microdochium trichocladiopsis]
MKVSDVVSQAKLDMAESQNQRDARVEALWRKLDYQNKGELDWQALQKGLKKIDHPMKNADDMLKAIIKVVDTNGDDKIQYEEFRVFVEATERQLYYLFRAIDHDQDGKLNQEELQTAFQRAGLSIPRRRLSEFFDNIDHNRDGYITFEEWRDFLLFMPNADPTTTLRAVFTFYSDILTLTSEGDSVVTGETLQGLGTSVASLLQTFLGSIVRLASPHTQSPSTPPPPTKTAPSHLAGHSAADYSTSAASTVPSHDQSKMADASQQSAARAINTSLRSATAVPHDLPQSQQPFAAKPTTSPSQLEQTEHDSPKKGKNKKLISFLPDSGYFVAGAVAGGISRTATAPLDRLKVYLLVKTDSGSKAKVALDAAKKGQPVKAAKRVGGPLLTAITELYKSGGVRGFFAGNGLNVVKIMPETAIRFGAYEAAKKTMARIEGHEDPTRITSYSKFMAGGLAGMVSQFCVYPLDTLKFRLQSEYVEGGARGNQLLVQTARKMMSEGFTKSAYRGVTMGLIGMFPYSAIDMGTFELLKKTYVSYKAKQLGCHEEDTRPSTFATGIMGASSGAFGATVVYPLNVLRTRLQSQGTSMHPARYTGIWDVAQKTYRNEGIRGMYKGLAPNLFKVAPALSITWMVYEKAKYVLDLK